jgi:hypothetical protein
MSNRAELMLARSLYRLSAAGGGRLFVAEGSLSALPDQRRLYSRLLTVVPPDPNACCGSFTASRESPPEEARFRSQVSRATGRGGKVSLYFMLFWRPLVLAPIEGANRRRSRHLHFEHRLPRVAAPLVSRHAPQPMSCTRRRKHPATLHRAALPTAVPGRRIAWPAEAGADASTSNRPPGTMPGRRANPLSRLVNHRIRRSDGAK